MEIMILDQNDDIEILRPLAEMWQKLSQGQQFALPIDATIGLRTMRALQLGSSSDVLVLTDKTGRPCGVMGLAYRPNHVGPGLIARECCLFVDPAARGAGLELIAAAKLLGKRKGCGWLSLTASRIAGDANRAGRLYEHCGGELYESSFLVVL